MTDTDRARLAAILGMLGSAHAGERAAAALQAEAFRRKHGLSWGDVLGTAQPAQAEVSEPVQPQWTPPQPQQTSPRPTRPDIVLHPNMPTRWVVMVSGVIVALAMALGGIVGN